MKNQYFYLQSFMKNQYLSTGKENLKTKVCDFRDLLSLPLNYAEIQPQSCICHDRKNLFA